MISERLAKTLSILLGPHLWLPLLLAVFLLKAGLTTRQIYNLLPFLLLLQVLVPLVSISIALKLKMVSAWDLPKRKERYFILLVYLFSFAVSLAIIKILGNPLLFDLNLIFFILIAILVTITLFWKISIHASLNTAGAIFLNFLFGWQLPYLYLVILLTFWARYKLKRHTISQLLAGVILGVVITLGSLLYLGYT